MNATESSRPSFRRRRTIAIDYRMCRASGIGVYLREVVSGLVARHSEEFRLVLVGGDEVPGTEHRRCDAPIYSVAELVQMPLLLPRDADVTWSPNYNTPLYSPGRLIVTVHDVNHLALPELLDSALKAAYARMMFANVKRRSAKIMCVSEFTAGELTRFTGIARDRIVVIPQGINDSWRQGPAADPPTSGPYALFVGNMKPHKNVGRLLAAFERLRDHIPHRLVIVGKREGFITPDRDIARLAAALGDRVVFAGEVSPEILRAYYGGAELLVFPSLYEGFGFPPLEAMAMGVPVAASNVASIPEVCGDAAAYFDPTSVEAMASVIRALIEEPALRARLRAAGARQSARYTWDRVIIRVAEVLRAAAA